MAEGVSGVYSLDTKEMQDERESKRLHDEPRGQNPHVGETRTERGQKNKHWKRVIHYQHTRQPHSNDHMESNWEGVQQTKTTAVDLEAERMAAKARSEQSERPQGVEQRHEQTLLKDEPQTASMESC